MLEHREHTFDRVGSPSAGGVIPPSQLYQRVHAPESFWRSIFLLLVNCTDAVNGAVRCPRPADRPAVSASLGAFVGQPDWRDGQGLPHPQAEAAESATLTLGDELDKHFSCWKSDFPFACLTVVSAT